jgi:hypothetical protein
MSKDAPFIYCVEGIYYIGNSGLDRQVEVSEIKQLEADKAMLVDQLGKSLCTLWWIRAAPTFVPATRDLVAYPIINGTIDDIEKLLGEKLVKQLSEETNDQT